MSSLGTAMIYWLIAMNSRESHEFVEPPHELLADCHEFVGPPHELLADCPEFVGPRHEFTDEP